MGTRKLLTLTDNELRLFYYLLTGVERDRAIEQSHMTKYDVVRIVYKIDNELAKRAAEKEAYKKGREFIQQEEKNRREALKVERVRKKEKDQ